MVEFELKFQVPPEQRALVKAFVAGRLPQGSQRIRLQASYFDTPDRMLARNQIALRLRREAGGWVQTLKGIAADGLGRDEHNLPLGDAAVVGDGLEIDPDRHANVPLGRRVAKLLADQPGALQCRYRSDIRRLTRRLRTRYGSVELAFDEGHLQAAGRRLAVCELEIEAIDGHPLAVLDVARRWALRYGLWLDTRSKSERGDMLARDIEMAPPCHAVEVVLLPTQTARAALQRTVAACREQILANAAQLASGRFEAGHLHQLRVGLRRLRSGLQLFADDPSAAALALPLTAPVTELFRELGVARDRSVLNDEIASVIAAAMREAGVPGAPAALAAVAPLQSPAALIRRGANQRLLLDLIEIGLPALAPATDKPAADAMTLAALPVDRADRSRKGLRKQLARRLGKWHRQVIAQAQQFDSLDEAGRHHLRKRVKRLRYAAEISAGLFDRKKLRPLLKPLRRVQQWLGELNDLSTALQALDSNQSADPAGWFARGWLLARRDALLTGAEPVLHRLATSKPNWRR